MNTKDTIETAPKLPKAFKRKWVKALRSGEYEQGKEYLFDSGKYCCLGVAAIVCGTKTSKIEDESMLEIGMVPDNILAALNFARSADTRQDSLATKNDGGWSFKRIATWIERYL